jgi:hypothetical protein
MEGLLKAGYTNQTILDVILGVAVKVMSNYTNHMAHTTLDEVIKPLEWSHPSKSAQAKGQLR